MKGDLAIAAIVTLPGWLVCVQLHYQDQLRAWARRLRRNRIRRLARRNDMVAMRRHQAYRRIGGQL